MHSVVSTLKRLLIIQLYYYVPYHYIQLTRICYSLTILCSRVHFINTVSTVAYVDTCLFIYSSLCKYLFYLPCWLLFLRYHFNYKKCKKYAEYLLGFLLLGILPPLDRILQRIVAAMCSNNVSKSNITISQHSSRIFINVSK